MMLGYLAMMAAHRYRYSDNKRIGGKGAGMTNLSERWIREVVAPELRKAFIKGSDLPLYRYLQQKKP